LETVNHRVVFDVIKELKPSWRGEYEITDTIRLMMQKGLKKVSSENLRGLSEIQIRDTGED